MASSVPAHRPLLARQPVPLKKSGLFYVSMLCVGKRELAKILLGDEVFLAREYGLYSRKRGGNSEHVAVKAARVASLGKSTNKLKGALTPLSCLLST